MSKVVALGSNAVEKDASTAAENEETKLENGDVFVADTSEYIGKWDGKMLTLPLEICMVVDSYEYVYKLERREKRVQEAI